MKRTHVYLDDTQPDGLKEIAEREKTTEAELIRRAVALLILIMAETGSIAAAMTEARSTFDDADTHERALIRQLLHWAHGREENSIRGSLRRVEAKLDELLGHLKDMQGDL